MGDTGIPGIPDGLGLVGTMGWRSLPYGTLGIARRAKADTHQLWSWLILIPWAENDSKPWIDGTKMVPDPNLTNEQQREKVFEHLREVLDKRYGQSVGERAADDFIKKLRAGD